MPSLTETLRWLTLIAWMVWFVGYWDGGRRVFEDIQRFFHNTENHRDMWLMLVIVFLSLIIVATGFLVTTGEPMISPVFNHSAITTLGIALTLLGMTSTVFCRRYLGRFWTANTSVQPDHQVVEGGPYGYVRHPIYTGAVIMYAGTALVFPTWWNVIAILLVILAYIHKTHEEDLFLGQNLTGYTDYQRRVPYRLFPRIW
jgi:protein-S-isoprenylcysteine O-methyltransferase Ste14